MTNTPFETKPPEALPYLPDAPTKLWDQSATHEAVWNTAATMEAYVEQALRLKHAHETSFFLNGALVIIQWMAKRVRADDPPKEKQRKRKYIFQLVFGSVYL